MLNFSFNKLPLSKSWLIVGSLITSVVFVFLLCLFFEPKWETCDDVVMSMTAHGYGIARTGVPHLIFSNVLWGYLVRAIPEINGVLGYSIATLSVLVIVGTVLIYGLYQLGADYVTCLLILVLILLRPVLFPQFTVNAGLLMMAAIICWQLYVQQHDKQMLFLGCLLAFFSYLVRREEFLLVLLVALPLLSWRTLFSYRFTKIAFSVLITAIVASAIINYNAYQGVEWNDFNALNPARAPFTDYGAGAYLKQYPGILQRSGYSNNDLDLIENWFFVDPHIANPDALQSMLAERGYFPDQKDLLTNAWIGAKALASKNLRPLMLAALLLIVVKPRWQLGASWGLFIAAILSFSLLGRPGVLRVYIPLVSLLIVAPLFMGRVSIRHNRLLSCILFAAVALNVAYVFSESKAFKIAAHQTRKDLADFPNESVIVWGAALPFESVYSVLVNSASAAMHYRLDLLSIFTLAPFSNSFAEAKKGNGMINLLVTEKGVPIISNDQYFKLLEIYCKEHFHGQLKELSSRQYGKVVVSLRQCEVKT